MKDAIEKAAEEYAEKNTFTFAVTEEIEIIFKAGAEFEQARAEKLLGALKQIQDAVVKNAEDTVWFSPYESLYDFIYTAVKEYEAGK